MNEAPPQYAPGQQLAGTVYRVVRHLATGGMGSVYDVEDITVGKRYVLKTLHPQLVSRQDLAKRMEAEARALAKLQHPNIVDVVTAGVTTDEKKMPFYVMERLNGQNLRVVIEKKGSLEITHCYRIAIDVLDALEHAHENGVIHRDVKPDNIFLHRNVNGTTITKLLDFGIMRMLDQKASHTSGKFIGTLRYASPEQIFGGTIGPASDIYSLGIVLYEMLAGRGPFDEVGDAYAIGAAHAQRPPPPVSTFVQIPRDLEALVMTALAKQPGDRPRDCFSFASALRRMLREEEAAPKSATQMNVLSSVPGTRSAVALAGTVPSSDQQIKIIGLPVGPGAPPNGTDRGMIAPSGLPAPLPVDQLGVGGSGGLPSTVRQDPAQIPQPYPQQRAPQQAPPQPIIFSASSPKAETTAGEIGNITGPVALAATLASEPPGPFSPSDAPPAPLRPGIDRGAETHPSGGVGHTRRLAQHDTAMDDGLAVQGIDELLRGSIPQQEPVKTPRYAGQPQPTPAQGSYAAPAHTGPEIDAIVFPPIPPSVSTGTGPLAGEARTRPPAPRGSMFWPVFGASLAGVAFVGAGILFMTKPWVKVAAPTSTTSASAVAAAPPAPMAPSTVPTGPTAAPAVAAGAAGSPAGAAGSPAVAAGSPAAPGAQGASPSTSEPAAPAPVAQTPQPAPQPAPPTPARVPAVRAGGRAAPRAENPPPHAEAPPARPEPVPAAPPPAAPKPAAPAATHVPSPSDIVF